MEEIWKDVVGLEDRYQVSNFGRVRSKERFFKDKRDRNRHVKEKILKPVCKEYKEYVLKHSDGKQHTHLAHRLVSEAFIPNPNNYPVINHKDENKYNNNVDNLEWCTYSYNCTYNDNNKKIGKKLRGRPTHNSIKVRCVETGIIYRSISEASKLTGIRYSTIQDIIQGKRHSYKGISFKRV